MTRHGMVAAFGTLLLATLAGCSKGADDGATATPATDAAPAPPADETKLGGAAPAAGVVQASAVTPIAKVDPVVVLHTSLGNLVVRLHESKAPRTVSNFMDYARVAHYEGTAFHHIESGKLAIAGAFDKEMKPKPVRYPVPNEATNGLKNVRGSLAMIHDPGNPHSATAAFFINLADNPNFDHQDSSNDKFGYCVFGQVIEGLDVLDKFAAVQTSQSQGFSHLPVETVVINSVKLMTMGVNTNVRPASFDNRPEPIVERDKDRYAR